MTERRLSSEQVPLERRKRDEPRVSLPRALRAGWLAFESKTERRRLAPPPDAWDEMSDDELVDLLEGAEPKPKLRRLIE